MYQNDKYVEFLGWEGSYARFRIHKTPLPNGYDFKQVVVTHEGDWISVGAMCCYPEYRHYEDVQQSMGKGLIFIGKQFRGDIKRSVFRFKFWPWGSGEYILAVPATGEEVCFEIYGIDSKGNSTLLVEREL